MVPCSVTTVHEPSGLAVQLGDAVAGVNLGAGEAGGLRIGHRRAVGVEVALDRVPQGADEVALVDQRQQRLRLGGGDDLRLHAEIAAARMRHLQPVEPLGRIGELQPAGEVQPAALAGDRLDLLIEPDRVGLQLGDVRVGVEGVKAAGRVPGGARCKLAPLDQHHVFPAGLGEMVENRAADDAATDHRDLCVGFHGMRSNGIAQPSNASSKGKRDRSSVPVSVTRICCSSLTPSAPPSSPI